MPLRDRQLANYELGFGHVIEVPAVCYCDGLVSEMLSPWVRTPCMMLPKGVDDMNWNYLRGKRLQDNGIITIDHLEGRRRPLPDPPWFRTYRLERIIVFFRGRLNLAKLHRIRTAATGSFADFTFLAYHEYLMQLHYSVMRRRNWNLTFYQFIDQKEPGEYRDRLEEVRRMHWFDRSVETHLTLFAARVEEPLLK